MTTTSTTNQQAAMPERRLWTRQEYERFVRLGAFGPDDRLELIGGEIVNKMASMDTPHATSILLTTEQLRVAFPVGVQIRVQLPLAVSDHSEPEPDIAVVAGTLRDFEDNHPTTALLVVEVADTSLAYDRSAKAALYAKAGIGDYWLLNMNERRLEAHRQPQAMPNRPLGYGYAQVTNYDETQTVTPLAAPNASIAVADLLPRRRA